MSQLLMVTGASPGLGKTTLARNLCGVLQARGASVRLLEEHEVLRRQEFAEVIAAIRTRGSATIEQLVDAADRYLSSCRRERVDANIVDAVLPFFPSRLSRGNNDHALLTMCEALGPRFATFESVQLHITGDARVALERAIAREAPGWLQAVVAAERRHEDATAHPVAVDEVVAYLQRSAARTARLLTHVTWRVERVDADPGPEAALEQALSMT